MPIKKSTPNHIDEAITRIAQAANVATLAIGNAADLAVKLIASNAEAAAKVVSTAAAESAKAANMKGQDDHDLLIRIETRMEGLKADIKELKDGTSTQLIDHETRIKKLENKTSNYFITITLYSIAMGAMISLIIYHMIK